MPAEPQRAEVKTENQALADELALLRPPGAGQAAPLSALCLSGGGIRSAAFSLGVLQALAKAGLLSQFDYLSTVSGGGFIGGWLSALVRQGAAVDATVANPTAPAVKALRGYTNYLTPQTGVMSEDSWTGIMLYLRNVLITWLGFGPIFVLAVLLAIAYRTLIWAVSTTVPWAWGCGLLSFGLLVFATWHACLLLPSHRPDDRSSGGSIAYAEVRAIWRQVAGPLLVWAFVVPLPLARWLAIMARDDAACGVLPPVSYAACDALFRVPRQGLLHQAWLPIGYALAITAGYWLAALAQREARLYWRNFIAWLAATLASALALWFGMLLCRTIPPGEEAEFLAVAGPLWLTLASAMHVTAYVALRREAKLADLDREWLARLSAVKLRWPAMWAGLAFCCLSLQRLAFPEGPAGGWPFWAVPVVTLASGPVGAWLGKQATSRLEAAVSAPDLVQRLQRALPLLALMFAASVVTLLGHWVGVVLGDIQGAVPSVPRMVAMQLGVAAVLAGLIWLAMRGINVNRFSMHGVYRNRLTRAFLGAARAGGTPPRAADPFSEFDPDDNIRLASLQGGGKLFPVLNMALNLTATARTDWAERKAASFTMTPLACGSSALGGDAGCFVATAAYAGSESESGTDAVQQRMGMTLASAMTISGAAISPNWGYHSSPLTAFLMTLFNVRLGAWLPNPAVVTSATELAQARPRNAFWPLLGDLFGTTSERSRAVYLSDGGHFDNLGLYEMLRRRCGLIVVVDAGQDPACDFADLGTALRRACIDQNVHVQFDGPVRIAARSAGVSGMLGFAVAGITYPLAPDAPAGAAALAGRLLYLKPCYLDDLPADVRAYGATDPAFPHDSTLEQWFTESQFESYRHLGQHQMGKLAAVLPPSPTVEALFEQATKVQAAAA